MNIVVTREDNKDAENVKEFIQSYQSPEVAKAAETILTAERCRAGNAHGIYTVTLASIRLSGQRKPGQTVLLRRRLAVSPARFQCFDDNSPGNLLSDEVNQCVKAGGSSALSGPA